MQADLISVVAPVFFTAALGYGWVALGNEFEFQFVSAIVMNVAAPALVVAALARHRFAPAEFALVGLAGVAAMVAAAGLAFLILKIAGQPVRELLPSLTFPNAGNMGLAVNFLAFGSEGLAFGIVLFTIWMGTNSIAGPWIASGETSLRTVARTPIIYAVVAGIALQLTRISLPEWTMTTMEMVGSATIPLMLITLGASLGRLKLGLMRSVALLGGARLLIGLMVGIGIGWAFGLDGVARGVLIVAAAMPTAVVNYLFAQRYGRDPEIVAGVVLVSTALSFLALPALVWLATSLAGVDALNARQL